MMKELAYWLALQQKYWLIPAEKIEQALQKLGSMEKFWDADDSSLLKLGLNDKDVMKLSEYKKSIQINYFESQLEELGRKEIKFIRYIDKEYPHSLKRIPHAPRGLFHKGSLLDFSNCVTIGGTRKCSEYGRKKAFDISRKLAENGYTIVSGLAIGIDTEAHKGALYAGGKTVAILAWMEPIYPPDNINLSRQITEQGVILSECYRKPYNNIKWRFVERNKIISGISKCVVVMETGEEGGTIQLAKFAYSQGREVFVLEPKKENESLEKGYKLLLRMGANPIKSDKDVLDFLKGETTQLSSESKKTDLLYQSSLTTSTKSG